jgi:hypothetical protein
MSLERKDCLPKVPERSSFAKLKGLIVDFYKLPPKLQKQIEIETKEILSTPPPQDTPSFNDWR